MAPKRTAATKAVRIGEKIQDTTMVIDDTLVREILCPNGRARSR
jgi:hypothetical protein